METSTIILITVLSTLSVVAIITMVVVAFYKLGKSVDDLENNIYKSLDETRTDMFNLRDENTNHFNLELSQLRKELDSRFDKLDNKIRLSTMNLSNSAGPISQSENTKQILQG